MGDPAVTGVDILVRFGLTLDTPEQVRVSLVVKRFVMLFDEEDESLLFVDRAEAGRILGVKLSGYLNQPNVTVLALPRGGVPVAFEVAQILHAPLDVFLVGKLGVPGNPELAMGAVASGGICVLNEEVVQAMYISEDMMEAVVAEADRELRRREELYRRSLPACDPAGRLAILVDDGMATGSTMRAAVAALRQRHAARIVIAVPVAPLAIYYELKKEADDLVCLVTPETFLAISQFYEQFGQVSDEEVTSLLEQGGSRLQGGTALAA